MLTDYLLLQFVGPAPDLLSCQQFCADSQLTLYRLAHNEALAVSYVYAKLPQQRVIELTESHNLQKIAEQSFGRAVSVSRLQLMLTCQGHSAETAPHFHYVVEMDPEAGWMPEISRWYDQEHMPGLAAVPGSVLAMRLLNHDSGPLSLACYDLLSAETLGSPDWLAVRASQWSDITRPHFTNTKRTMFEVIA
jgi:hypothetical protein